jgi:hypothetical protein
MSKSTKFIDSLSAPLQELVQELEEVDIQLLSKHLPNFNSTKELAALIAVGADVSARRKELQEIKEGQEKSENYGAKLVQTVATILGISESTLFHSVRLVEIFGADYLQEIAADAAKQNIKLTFSHLRELNRLDSPDWAEDRLAIISRIFSQELVTSRHVQTAVDTLLGDPDKSAGQNFDKDPVLGDKKLAAKADKKGDALDELASSDDIDTLCDQLVELINQVDKKFEKIGEKIRLWREDVAIETLQSMALDSLDCASSAINDLAFKIKDIGIVIDDTMRTVTATVEV